MNKRHSTCDGKPQHGTLRACQTPTYLQNPHFFSPESGGLLEWNATLLSTDTHTSDTQPGTVLQVQRRRDSQRRDSSAALFGQGFEGVANALGMNA